IQKFILGASTGFMALMLVLPSEILHVATYGRFTSGGTALAILGMQGLLMSMVVLYTAVLNVQLRVWSSTLVWTVMAGAVLLLDLLLIPRFGIAGAAWA